MSHDSDWKRLVFGRFAELVHVDEKDCPALIALARFNRRRINDDDEVHEARVENIPNNLIDALVLSMNIMESAGFDPNTMNRRENRTRVTASQRNATTPRHSSAPSDSNNNNNTNSRVCKDLPVHRSTHDMSMPFSSCFTNDGKVDMEKFIKRRRQQIDESASFDNTDDDTSNKYKSATTSDMSLSDCFTKEGNIDIANVFLRRQLDIHDLWESNFDEEYALDPSKEVQPKKRCRGPILARRAENGELEEIKPTQSLWYILYVSSPNVNCKRFRRKFRGRFRMPYSSFVAFAEEARVANWFPRWTSSDATGKTSSPLELLILGSLRYLGRGWTFDDCEESTAISEEVHRVFFHQFIKIGSTVLFDKYVLTPQNIEEVERHMAEFKMAGLPGACGSCDATCIIHEMCSHRLQRLHKGHKSKHPQRTYNATVNHLREILGTTSGHPGSYNDKSTILYDEFIKDIKSGAILDDYEFELLERRDGKVIAVKYRGVWVVVDNGYHNWSVTVPPFTNSNRYDEIRWSEWIESMRKDVEVR